MYRYIHNLQGDIVAIVDAAGNPVVEYKYDAWGRITYETDLRTVPLNCIGIFRYRGYVYDEEVDLYYLRNRYYDAKHMRFINPDEYMGEGLGNLFSYTCNAVTGFADSDGNKTYACGVVKEAYIGFFSSSIAEGYCWDDQGNEGTFITYGGLEGNFNEENYKSENWPDGFSTTTLGLFSIGVAGFYSETNLESIEQLNGISCSIGIAGFDALYAGSISDQNNEYLGFQVSKGVSLSLDFGHLSNQYTVVTVSAMGSDKSSKTIQTGGNDYWLKTVYDPLLGCYREVRIYD